MHDIMNNVGVDNAGEPPVPIPNTEVKPSGAEDTFLETGWKNREMPILVNILMLPFRNFRPVFQVFFYIKSGLYFLVIILLCSFFQFSMSL